MLTEGNSTQDEHEQSKEEQGRSSMIAWERETAFGRREAFVTLGIVLFPSFPPKLIKVQLCSRC